MKLLLTVMIIMLSVLSFIFGANDRVVLAGVSAYLAVSLLLLTVWHYSRKHHKQFEEDDA